jgi:hypothetical protein
MGEEKQMDGVNGENRSSSGRNTGHSGRVTRREWLAELGAAALAAGLPGEARPATLDGGAVNTELPPGLYAPSSEHLGHALESDALFHAVPARTETDFVRPVSGPFQPGFFSEDEFATVRRLVELLLGFPGAERRQTGVTQEKNEYPADAVVRWIDLRMASASGVRQAARDLSPEHHALAVAFYGAVTVHRLETAEPEKTCREGLAWLGDASRRRYGTEFLKLSQLQQIDILESLSNVSGIEGRDHAGRFFALIKDETIRGYYTSQRGLHELDYRGNAFYPESPGCAEDHPDSSR